MAEQNILKPQVHDIHPSLANLQGAIGNAKLGLSVASAPQSYKVNRVEQATNLKSGDLRPFKVSGERNFIVLVDNIQLYDDKTLTTIQSDTISLEKDCIVSGTYLYNDTSSNVVLLGNPYNVYCAAADVEPQDLNHSTYIQHDTDDNNNNASSNPQNQEQEQSQSSTSAPKEEFMDVNLEDNDTKTHENIEHRQQATMRVINMEANETIAVEDNIIQYIAPTTELQHGASISATIPDIDIIKDYPAGESIKNLEDNRPSFISTLPAKQVSHSQNEVRETRPSTEKLVERKRTDSYEAQQQHVTSAKYNAMKDNSQRNINEYKYFLNNFLFRTLILSVTLLLVTILLMPEWFRSMDIKTFKTSYGISAFGIFVIFLAAFGSICGGILEIAKINIPNKTVFIYFIMVLYITGGVFYFIGACAVAHSWNLLLGKGYAAYGGVWWCEMFYISVISIVTGIDLKKQILNRWDLRVTFFVSLLVFDGFILSICSMVIGSKPFVNNTYTTLGVMYLLTVLTAFVFLIMRLLTVMTDKIQANDKIELGLMSLLLVFWVCAAFTYWALAGVQTGSYYVGMGMMQIIMALFVTFDVSFCQYVIPRICVKTI